MTKEEIIKEINNIANNHITLAENIYTSPINDCDHKGWYITGGVLKKVTLSCPSCGLEFDDLRVIDFVEKNDNNTRASIRNVLKRIEILIEDNLTNPYKIR